MEALEVLEALDKAGCCRVDADSLVVGVDTASLLDNGVFTIVSLVVLVTIRCV